MPLIVSSKSGSEIEPVPAGLHASACVGVYDVGTQHSDLYGKDSRKVIIQWELPELPPLDAGPRMLSRRFTMSLNAKANLRAFLEGWRGRKFTEAELAGFDLSKLLGAPCMLQVMHDENGGKTYANISAAIPMPKGQTVKVATKPTLFSVEDLTVPTLPQSLPQWIGDLVKTSREWQRLVARPRATAPASAEEDDFATTTAPAEEDPFA